MQWSEAVGESIETLTPVKEDQVLFERIWGLIDLTSLNDTDNESNIAVFLEKAQSPLGHVAAVCVYPPFVRIAAAQFANTPIKVATVANFPEGTTPLDTVLIEIGSAMQDGAQEIDLVFPYQRYLAGERQYVHTFIEACKAVCGEDVTLKVILETGALNDYGIIADASYDVIAAGADFLKTSTGKISEGATLEAAATMLLVIKHVSTQFNRRIGFKAAGGIRDVQEAAQYIQLADRIMGREWVKPENFRIGTSRLADQLLKLTGGNV